MRPIPIVCTVLALTLGGASSANADPTYRRDVPANLAAEAKISESDAVATAQRTVSNSTVVAVELEREHKTLLYSVDLKVPGHTGVTEVEVDANDGKVLASEHEDDDEASQPR
jgi:uncharacterized membrane protein YkoI